MAKAPYNASGSVITQGDFDKAVAHIRELEAEVERLEGELAEVNSETKIVSVASTPIGFMCVDNKGQLYERVNDPTPRGPGPQGKMWVHVSGPKRQ